MVAKEEKRRCQPRSRKPHRVFVASPTEASCPCDEYLVNEERMASPPLSVSKQSSLRTMSTLPTPSCASCSGEIVVLKCEYE
jgi:hypothetical protein